jgi:hypothetical protein
MKLVSWLIFLSSALVYVLPFWFSASLWWLVFLFPIPLVYVGLQERISFKEGCVWGFVAYTLHLGGVLWGTMALARGSYMLRIIPSLFMIAYPSLFTGVWFWLIGIVKERFCPSGRLYCQGILWCYSLWLYSLWLDRYCLFLFDRCEGYSLMHPLIPLAEAPALLQLMPYVGKQFLTLAFYAFAVLIAIMLIKPTKMGALACSIVLIPWALSLVLWFSSCKKDAPRWFSRIVHLPKKFPRKQNVSVTARMLREEIKGLLDAHPAADIVVVPESSVYSPHLFSNQSLAAYVGPDHIEKSIHLLLGSFYNDNDQYRNSCYWLKNGVVQERFDKRHTMVMIERVPFLLKNTFLKNMYFSVMPEIIYSENKRPLLSLSEELRLVPYICSELFFNEYPDDMHTREPIILIANDNWASIGYVRHLMYLVVRFKAIQWQRTIIYISYHYALLCDDQGHTHTVQSSQ